MSSFNMLSSLIRATSPNSPIDLLFINPLVSVLPRVIAALLTHLSFRGLSKVIKTTHITSTLTGMLMAFFNTLFTLPLLILFIQLLGKEKYLPDVTYIALLVGTLPQILAEMAVGALLTGLIYLSIRVVQGRTEAKEEEEIQTDDSTQEE